MPATCDSGCARARASASAGQGGGLALLRCKLPSQGTLECVSAAGANLSSRRHGAALSVPSGELRAILGLGQLIKGGTSAAASVVVAQPRAVAPPPPVAASVAATSPGALHDRPPSIPAQA